MRLWHRLLVPVLPRKQLQGQWRECCAIASNIASKGTPNHLLVDKILEYPPVHFRTYCIAIWCEMKERGYKIYKKSENALFDNIDIAEENGYFKDLGHGKKQFCDWFTDRYLIQCYYNLQEKYDCGGITDEEWAKIETFMDEKGLLK